MESMENNESELQFARGLFPIECQGKASLTPDS